jgi:serine/threonine-protein kinase
MLGRYELLGSLSTGGMAEIFLARQTGIEDFEKLVVVKKILPQLANEEAFVEMFLDEARIAAKLNHPNIVQIYDLGQEGNEYFIAMEYLEGESLGYLVNKARKEGYKIPPAIAAGIIAQVCDGLDYAHKYKDVTGKPQDIVHRDVSPQNIIVLFTGLIKLVDFGIAKAASQMHKTCIGTLKGKLAYMSPEQCTGKQLDFRSDIFSVGVVFWEILTRQRLFKRDSEAEVVNAIKSKPIPNIREIRPEISSELEAVVHKALEKNPQDRFQSAAEMGSAIRRYLQEMGVSAGIPEIHAFVDGIFIFGARARTIHQALENILAKSASEISFGAIKPGSDASLPSRSVYVGVETRAKPVQVEPASQDFGEPIPATTAGNEILYAPMRIQDSEAPTTSNGILYASARIQGSEPKTTTQSSLAQQSAEASGRKITTIARILLPVIIMAAVVGLWSWVNSKPTKSVPPAVNTDTPGPSTASLNSQSTPEGGTGADGEAGGIPHQQKMQPTLLSIKSRPAGCKVKVDGTRISGLTPIDHLEVEPDQEHVVFVVCKGHRKESKRVTGAPAQKISMNFTPRRRAVLTRKAFGFLRFDTDPWSEVYLGSRKLGTTPLKNVKLPVGTHTLKALNRNMGIDKAIKVVIKPGKTTKLIMKLGE